MAAVVAGQDGTGEGALALDTAPGVPSELVGYLEDADEGSAQSRLTTSIWAEAATDAAVAGLAVPRNTSLRDARADPIG